MDKYDVIGLAIAILAVSVVLMHSFEAYQASAPKNAYRHFRFPGKNLLKKSIISISCCPLFPNG